jgi:tetratricopeptide (TPR) repeat protein
MPFSGKNEITPIMKKLIMTGVFLILFVPTYSQKYHIDSLSLAAFREIFHFRFSHAEALLEQEERVVPDNLIPVFISNYIDFFRLFIGENLAEFERLRENKIKRIRALEQGPKDSPYYRYCLAEVYLQWAFVRLKFGEYAMAGLEIRQAYLLLRENRRKYPDFIPNSTGLGVVYSLIGLIPDQYRWVADLIGLEGSVEEGFAEFTKVVQCNKGVPFHHLLQLEAGFFIALLDANIRKNEDEALPMLDKLKSDPVLGSFFESPLFIFAEANILIRLKKNDEAWNELSNYHWKKDTFPIWLMEYQKGLVSLNRLDTLARQYFNKFLMHFRGMNYIKSSYQKMAWIKLICNDTSGYREEIRKALTDGAAVLDEDKQAFSEATSGIIPALPLLKSRLLFDGGYYNRAIEVLISTSLYDYIRDRKDLTEYYYRLGRIYHEMGNINKAIEFYTRTLEIGKTIPHYFAANAALNLGNLYEQQGDYLTAASNYKLCLGLHYEEYETSIRQKAKAGLNRLKRESY